MNVAPHARTGIFFMNLVAQCLGQFGGGFRSQLVSYAGMAGSAAMPGREIQD